MVTSQFDALLKELEPFFNCPLQSDQNNSCLIKMASGIEIQLELDKYGENLMIGSRLGVLPSGRYREMVFREALKANHLFPPSSGVFGYSKKSGNLILFTFLNLRDINQDRMIAILTPFIKKAQTWAETIKRGEVPIASETAASQTKQGLFGLIH